jgi:hypothetical protein
LVAANATIESYRAGESYQASASIEAPISSSTPAFAPAVRRSAGDSREHEYEDYFTSGDLIVCIPPNPPNNAFIRLYRLNIDMHWERIPGSLTSHSPDGRLKVDGLPVDQSSFGAAGHPYRIELVNDGTIVKSIGNFQSGEPEFRIYPGTDNIVTWDCP